MSGAPEPGPTPEAPADTATAPGAGSAGAAAEPPRADGPAADPVAANPDSKVRNEAETDPTAQLRSELTALLGPILEIAKTRELGQQLVIQIGQIIGTNSGASAVTQGGAAGSTPGEERAQEWPQSIFTAVADQASDAGLLGALCILHDAPSASVLAAADALAEQLEVIAVEGALSRRPSDLSSILSQARARRYVSEQDLDAGFPVERLGFENDQDWRTALDYAWSSFRQVPGWRSAFVKWLIDLGEDPDDEVRLRAGRSIAALGPQGFRAAMTAVIDPWIGSSSTRPLTAVDMALAGFAEEPRLRTAIEWDIQSWADGHRGIDGYYAASRLAGGLFGDASLDFALSIGERLFARGRAIAVRQAAMAYVSLLVNALSEPDVDRALRIASAIEQLPPPQTSPWRFVWKDLVLSAIAAAEIEGERPGEARALVGVLAEKAEASAGVYGRLFAAALPRDRTRGGPLSLCEELVRRAAMGQQDRAAVWRFMAVMFDQTTGSERALLQDFAPRWIERVARLPGANVEDGRRLVATWGVGE